MKGSFKVGIFARADGWLKNILYAAPTRDIVGFGGAGFPRFSPVRTASSSAVRLGLPNVNLTSRILHVYPTLYVHDRRSRKATFSKKKEARRP